MSEIFKKGQIVPRRLNLIGVNKQKLRHLWKFGGTVRVEGKSIELLANGCVFVMSKAWVGGRNGKPREYAHSILEGVNITITEGVNGGALRA